MSDETSIVEIRISPQQAGEFMDRLINDTEFRERLVQNPVEELAGYGINVPPSLLPEQVELPSPEEIRQMQDRIDADEFSDGGGMIQFAPLWPALWWFRQFSEQPGP
jgi:putative modified peptide